MNAPTTRITLLARLRDADDPEAWREFVGLYAPLLYHYGRRNNLQDADAADLTQDVLTAVAGAGGLERIPQRGSFRSWLFTVAHHKLFDLRKRRTRPGHAAGGGGAVLDAIPDRSDVAAWDREYREAVFRWAAGRVQPRCSPGVWTAFWRTAVEGRPAQQVADELGLTVAAVYLAKSRVMARLKEQVRHWEGG